MGYKARLADASESGSRPPIIKCKSSALRGSLECIIVCRSSMMPTGT